MGKPTDKGPKGGHVGQAPKVGDVARGHDAQYGPFTWTILDVIHARIVIRVSGQGFGTYTTAVTREQWAAGPYDQSPDPGDPEPDRKAIGLMLHNWHSGMDPVYAVGSFYVDGRAYPDASVVERAIAIIETLIPAADHGAHGWGPDDAAELRTLTNALRYYLSTDYAGES